MEKQVTHILKHNQLSVTDSRVKILELFLVNNGALAHGDIEKKSATSFDRVTIYRTLQTFLDKGIIHSIPTADNAIRYALCKDDCSEGHHQDNHIHFICNDCGNTTCLDDVTIPEINLPKGFEQQQVDVVISGTCATCKK